MKATRAEVRRVERELLQTQLQLLALIQETEKLTEVVSRVTKHSVALQKRVEKLENKP